MNNKNILMFGTMSLILAIILLSGCTNNQVGKAIPITNGTNPTNQTGSLYVASSPSGASLYVDNIYKGVTPYTASGLTIGNHAVKLTKTGYNTYTTTKYIYARSNTLNVTLTTNSTGNPTNQTGSLYVASSPSGASLYVDNIYKGVTPYTASGLTIGNHAVKLTKTGYNTYTTTKYIYAGSNTLNVTLTTNRTAV
ncbi:MAG: PEGA domain-containing protein [Candidatus Woesearchaeota archaeon]